MVERKLELFKELAGLTEEISTSNFISCDDFVGKYQCLYHQNGGDWSRKESRFCRIYKLLLVRRNFDFDYRWDKEDDDIDKNALLDEWANFTQQKNISQGKGKAIIAYKVMGLLEDKNEMHQTIRNDIRKIVSNRRCCVSYVGTNIEVDHKNGRKNNVRVMTTKTQIVDDFQAMSKAINDAKRQHCKNCIETGKRFNAKELGYRKGWTEGGALFGNIKNPNGCVGCYWYDPIAFNKDISSLPDIEEIVSRKGKDILMDDAKRLLVRRQLKK